MLPLSKWENQDKSHSSGRELLLLPGSLDSGPLYGAGPRFNPPTSRPSGVLPPCLDHSLEPVVSPVSEVQKCHR